MAQNNEYVTFDDYMIKEDKPYHRVVIDKETHEIVNQRIVLWCYQNVECKWIMLGPNIFLFESGEEAINFALKFG